MKFALVFISLAAYSLANTIETYGGIETTLQHLHVVFRHGDRTPDSLYPNDPYTEESFWPFRIGHLTNEGKRTAYKIGTYLRSKYGKILGNVYTPDILSTISSHYARCKASLQAVLAGLYPPADILKWNSNLDWEPIPYDYLPEKDNKLFMAIRACKGYIPLMREAAESLQPEDPIVLKYNYLLPFLREVSGMTNSSLLEIGSNLYSTLKSEEELGLDLPSWADAVYPDILYEIASHMWKYYTFGDLNALQSGFLVSQIINNTRSIISGAENAKNRKIHLYSGHDLNVAALLVFLDNFEPHNPRYGAHIIIEVHKFLGIYFFKFLHQNYDRVEPVPLFIPNCGIYCPLEAFAKMYASEIDPLRLETLCG